MSWMVLSPQMIIHRLVKVGKLILGQMKELEGEGKREEGASEAS